MIYQVRDKRLHLVAEKETKGAVYSLCAFQVRSPCCRYWNKAGSGHILYPGLKLGGQRRGNKSPLPCIYAPPQPPCSPAAGVRISRIHPRPGFLHTAPEICVFRTVKSVLSCRCQALLGFEASTTRFHVVSRLLQIIMVLYTTVPQTKLFASVLISFLSCIVVP